MTKKNKRNTGIISMIWDYPDNPVSMELGPNSVALNLEEGLADIRACKSNSLTDLLPALNFTLAAMKDHAKNIIFLVREECPHCAVNKGLALEEWLFASNEKARVLILTPLMQTGTLEQALGMLEDFGVCEDRENEREVNVNDLEQSSLSAVYQE